MMSEDQEAKDFLLGKTRIKTYTYVGKFVIYMKFDSKSKKQVKKFINQFITLVERKGVVRILDNPYEKSSIFVTTFTNSYDYIIKDIAIIWKEYTDFMKVPNE